MAPSLDEVPSNSQIICTPFFPRIHRSLQAILAKLETLELELKKLSDTQNSPLQTSQQADFHMDAEKELNRQEIALLDESQVTLTQCHNMSLFICL